MVLDFLLMFFPSTTAAAPSKDAMTSGEIVNYRAMQYNVHYILHTLPTYCNSSFHRVQEICKPLIDLIKYQAEMQNLNSYKNKL